MKIAERTFRRKDWYVTSPFGWRKDPFTGAKKYHSGVDFGTKNQKWKQYALEDGTVVSGGTAGDGAKYCWIKYPRLGIRLQYWHLDTLNVKKGQKVTKDTCIGTTGKTGKATGIHLHLGMKYEKNLDEYVNAHNYNYTEAPAKTTTTTTSSSFFPKKGYFGLGDTHKNIGKIASFMYKTFPAYTKKEALGNYYGKNIQASIKEFQKRTKIEADGCVGPITLKTLKKYGFNE